VNFQENVQVQSGICTTINCLCN